MSQKPDGKPARERVTFTKNAAERIGRVVRKVEAGDRGQAPISWSPRVSNAARPYRYFRLTQTMDACGTAKAVRVKPVCCSPDDPRMDLVDLDEPEPEVTIFDHLGSVRQYNLILGRTGKALDSAISSGAYCLARWVPFANDSDEECGEGGVWELAGFLHCASNACSSESPSSSGPSSASSASASASASSASGSSKQSSWRSSGSGGSSECSDCASSRTTVVTDVSCVDGELIVTKSEINAAECCDTGSAAAGSV